MGLLINPYYFSSFSSLYSNDLGGTDEYVSLPNESTYDFGSSNFFIAAWFKTSTTGVRQSILTKIATSDFQYIMEVEVANTVVVVITNSTGNGIVGGRSASTYTDGNWHHALGVFNTSPGSESGKLYIDGSLVGDNNAGSLANAPYNSAGAGSVLIGAGNSTTPANFIVGKIAHPVIGNKFVSASEVSELYTLKMGNAATLSFAANVVSAFKYTNGTADYPTWTDYIGGNNGTMTNQESGDINTDIPT